MQRTPSIVSHLANYPKCSGSSLVHPAETWCQDRPGDMSPSNLPWRCKLHVCVYIYICVCVYCIYIYIYTYIHIESVCMYNIYLYIYILYVHGYIHAVRKAMEGPVYQPVSVIFRSTCLSIHPNVCSLESTSRIESKVYQNSQPLRP